jgi:hypothetical protein
MSKKAEGINPLFVIAIGVVYMLGKSSNPVTQISKELTKHEVRKVLDRGNTGEITIKKGVYTEVNVDPMTETGTKEEKYVAPEANTTIEIKKNDVLKIQINELEDKKEKVATEDEKSALQKEIDAKYIELQTPAVTIQTSGFTAALGFGALYSREVLPFLDLKFYYMSRWSIVAGINQQYMFGGITRHVDDLLPFNMKNVEFLVAPGLDYSGPFRIGFGLRSNF